MTTPETAHPAETRGAPFTAALAEAEGYLVDRHCYPWVAYKGPRFTPTTWRFIDTPEQPDGTGNG